MEGPDIKGWVISVRSDRLVLVFMAIWLLSLLLCLGVLVIFYPRLPDLVPFFFSRVWGEARLGDRELVWTLPAVAALIGGINFGLGACLHPTERFLARMMFGTGTLVTIFTLLTIVNIVLLML